jgi:hypothetical protein
MHEDLLIEFMDGRMEEAILSRPFDPRSNEISVTLGESGEEHQWPLSDLCCIHMTPTEMKFVEKAMLSEEVFTATNRTYSHPRASQ